MKKVQCVRLLTPEIELQNMARKFKIGNKDIELETLYLSHEIRDILMSGLGISRCGIYRIDKLDIVSNFATINLLKHICLYSRRAKYISVS